MDYKLKKLQNVYGVEVIENAESMCLTTYKSGGKISLLFRPADIEGLVEALNYLTTVGLDYVTLGNGSNTLFPDGGYDGAVVTLKRMKSVSVDGDIMYASSGMSYPVVAAIARDNHLSGLEFAVGIPASVGGAVAMNAGAYNAETADKIYDIDILNCGNVETLKKEEIKFVYRGSCVLDNGTLVLGARFRLKYGDRDEIENEMKRLGRLRVSTQPSEPSAGSVFKRYEGVSPAVYIQKLGLKGLRHGGAEISKKHANFIINTGGATTEDFTVLRDVAAEKVSNVFGIKLVPEVRVIGEK